MDDDLHIDLIPGRQAIFEIVIPPGGWRRVFSQEYIKQIRPIAETLAVMDGVTISDYQSFLQEADAVYRLHMDQPDEFSWVAQNRKMSEDPVCRELWNKLQVLLALKGKENGNV
jgi:L-rhamnose mutarotase